MSIGASVTIFATALFEEGLDTVEALNSIFAEFQNLTELSASLDVRYNPATDMLQIKINGVWTDYKKAYMQNLTIFADGQFRNGFAVGDNTNYAGYTPKYPMQYANSELTVYMPTVSERATSGSYFSKKIDVTNYSKLTMDCTYADTNYTLDIDVSNDTGEYWVGAVITVGYNSGYYYLPGIYINTDKSTSAYKESGPSGSYIRSSGTLLINSVILAE